MKKIIFWIGVAVLVIGIVLFGYAYTTMQNIIAIANSNISHPLDWLLTYGGYEQQWSLAQTLQPIGLGILVLGAIMLLYGLLVKKESK